MYAEQPYEDRLRPVLVVNTETDPAPAYAALEVCGFDADRAAFLVRRPTRSGASDVLFNGPTPIDADEEGQATPGPLAQAAWEDDGAIDSPGYGEELEPLVGSALGTTAGSWFLSPRYAGFRYVCTLGAEGDKLALVRPAGASQFDWVELTGAADPDAFGTPAFYSPAKLVHFDAFSGEFVDPPTEVPVFYADAGLAEVTYTAAAPARVLAALSGSAYGRPVYAGAAPAPVSAWKSPAALVRTVVPLPACTYSFGVLTGDANGQLTNVDGFNPNDGDTVLVASQVNKAHNGIYVVTHRGAAGEPFVLTRRPDADTAAKLTGAVIAVWEGYEHLASVWQCYSLGSITLGYTPLHWYKVGGSRDWKDPPANMATTAALPACTYALIAGEGTYAATLTGDANGALPSIDGVAPQVNYSVLVKDQAGSGQNGLYYVTTVGSAGTPFVLTRRRDMDSYDELIGARVRVVSGTTHAGTVWQSMISNGVTPWLWKKVGNVDALGTSVDNAVARHHGTTGQIIQNSLVLIDDGGVVHASYLISSSTSFGSPTVGTFAGASATVSWGNFATSMSLASSASGLNDYYDPFDETVSTLGSFATTSLTGYATIRIGAERIQILGPSVWEEGLTGTIKFGATARKGFVTGLGSDTTTLDGGTF